METSTRRWLVIFVVAALSFTMAACAGVPSEISSEAGGEVAGGAARAEAPERGSEEAGEHGGSEGEGEHGGSEGEGEGGHDSGEEGEESGVYIARDETWDATRRGARLVLSFNSETNAFEGTVENTTAQILCAVRVEVHLSSGTELGPTERADLPSGGTTEVRLPTAGEDFETWTAHPELSRCSGGQ